MKKYLLSFLSVGLLAGAFSPIVGQTRVGFLIGPSVPNLSGGSNEITQGYVSRLALHAGITVERDLNEHFSIQPGIIFDGQGGQRNGLQPFVSPTGDYEYADFKNASVLDYLEVPVLLRYKFESWKVHFQVNAGPYAGYLLSATQKTSGTSLIYADKNRTPLTFLAPPDYTQLVEAPPQSFDATTDIKDSIHKLNVGIEGGIGVDFPVTESQALSLELHGLYGFTNIQKYSADGTNHTGNLLISVGYSFVVAGV
jgi:Outer membrane protein beta-barrel domain